MFRLQPQHHRHQLHHRLHLHRQHRGDGSGGGLEFGYYYNVTMVNDLIWNNTANTGPDLANGSPSTINYTLVGNASGAHEPPNSVGNVFGVSTTPAVLGSLADNGGATQSSMPGVNSPELNAGGSVTTANAAVSSASASTINVASGYVFAASSLTPSLTFVNQPANTTAGATMSPVTVQVNKPIDFDEYIQIDSEIMEIVGLTINSDSTATLDVERGMDGTTPATHAANAPIYLISDQRGYVVNNQPTAHVDIGAVQSAGTIPTAGLGMALKMGISSGNLNGTTTALTNVSGQATFNNLSTPVAGTYQLVAAGITNSNSFTVSAGTYPTVTGVSPASGSSSGTATITGTNFTGATAVSFGGTAASNFTVNSSTSITATIPAGTGNVDVTVTNATGTSGVSASDRFSYAPGVTSVSPNVGTAAGGTVVTITGANFVGVTAVMFGPNNAASFTVNSPTSITATAPAGGNVVDITVVNAGGTSARGRGSLLLQQRHGQLDRHEHAFLRAGSLFAAVQNANATTLTPSLVTFDPSVFATPQTITLTESLNLSNTSQPIAIQGPSGTLVTVSGNRQGGELLQDFVIAAGMATIQNLIVADANAGTNGGGGFDIIGGNVTIDHCTITNNIEPYGAGISVNSGTVLLENSLLTGNTASANGGAIAFVGGAATVIGCTFTNNSATNNTGGGGAIYSGATSPLTVIDSTFTGNTSYSGYYGGGAIEVINGNLTLIGSTVTGNANISGSGSGGGTFQYVRQLGSDSEKRHHLEQHRELRQ